MCLLFFVNVYKSFSSDLYGFFGKSYVNTIGQNKISITELYQFKQRIMTSLKKQTATLKPGNGLPRSLSIVTRPISKKISLSQNTPEKSPNRLTICRRKMPY
ncbi:hypothetical protein N824_01675 [Pedobacter sp. V48]|nr:hypothetical protein N824_01675 [Pedobacter sp. V48]